MSSLQIQKLTKRASRLRMALIGPSGSGKTYTGLQFARTLTDKRILVIDTERESAGLYADEFNADDRVDTLALPTFSPMTYVEALEMAATEGYGAVLVDSLSHAWMGKEGALEQVDKVAKRTQAHNTFAAWREVTPMHNALVDAILQSPFHVIATMRTKTEYVLEQNERGKQVPRKIGLAPVQRDGLEYEFDIVADMDLENNLIISKTRMADLSGVVVAKPKADFAVRIREWLEGGAPMAVLSDPKKILESYRLDAEQTEEVKTKCKDLGLKFSDFLIEAYNDGDRGFAALLRRLAGIKLLQAESQDSLEMAGAGDE
jgi:hypothetical protein